MFEYVPKGLFVACKEKRSKLFYMILNNFINCLALIDIKETLHYKIALE